MPAFQLDEAQISDLRAFLQELDRPNLGVGQLRLGDPADGMGLQAAFETAVRNAAPSAEAVAGFETFASGICATCHVPFQTSMVNGPDLSTVVERWDDDALHQVLTAGRPERGMPPPVPAFSEGQRDGLIAYFRWLNENRDDLVIQTQRLTSGRDTDWSNLPWWEYR